MDRRRLLTGIGMALPTTLAGCFAGNSSPTSSDDDREASSSAGDDVQTTGDNNKDDDLQVIREEPRTDEPPHDIEHPGDPKETPEGDWNDEFLGEHLETEPSVKFNGFTISGSQLRLPEGWTRADSIYNVRLVGREEDVDSVIDVEGLDSDDRSRLDAIDFDEEVLVVVLSGYGSSSKQHQWARIEGTADGLHLHGYYTHPKFLDLVNTFRVSLLEVERPNEEVDLARVSLTVSEDERVHFNSTEGVVKINCP